LTCCENVSSTYKDKLLSVFCAGFGFAMLIYKSMALHTVIIATYWPIKLALGKTPMLGS
jgi:hypothetical protein